MSTSMAQMVDNIYNEMVSWRRKIHQHPELSGEERETSKFIYETLQTFGMDDIQYMEGTAVVALLKGSAGEGKCIAIREDIDALPMQEDTGLEFASQVPGVMHACGHDGHAAMLLGTAKVLCQMRSQIRGSVKFIFQHSEEKMPGGAIGLVRAGVLENPHVDAIIAAHIYPDERFGCIRTNAGPMSIGGTLVNVRVTGKGGHAARPHQANDVVLAGSELVVALQQVVSRALNPKEFALLSICEFHAGTAPNILPSEGYLSLNPRYYTTSARDIMLQKIKDVAEGIEKMSGCKIDLEFIHSYPPIFNDGKIVELVKNVCEANDFTFIPEGYGNGGDDFSYYVTDTGVPGVYFGLLAGYEGDQAYPIHSPRMRWNEEIMKIGVRTLAGTSLKFLSE